MRIATLILCICLTTCINAQKDTLTTDVNWPLGIAIKNNIMFIAESSDNEISTLDLTVPNANPVPFVTGLDRPNFLQISGDYLYFAEYYSGNISKVDLTQANPLPTTIVSGLVSPKSILIIDTILYFSEINAISKVNLTQPNPVPEVILTGLNTVINLATDGQYLYFSEYNGDMISKIDLALNNPPIDTLLFGRDGPLGGMAIKNNELYFFEYGTKEISVLDLTNVNSGTTNFDVGISGGDMLFNNNDFYVSDFENNLILKYPGLISSIENSPNQDIKIFPNPARDFIEISGVTDITNARITSATGQLIATFEQLNNNRIDVSSFPSGMYILTLENRWTYKILKI